MNCSLWGLTYGLALQRDLSRAIWLSQEGQQARADWRQFTVNEEVLMHNLFEKASNLRCTLKRRQPRNTLMFFLLQWENKDARQSTTCQLLLDDLPSNYCETKLFRENSYSNCFNCMIAFLVGKYWVSAKT